MGTSMDWHQVEIENIYWWIVWLFVCWYAILQHVGSRCQCAPAPNSVTSYVILIIDGASSSRGNGTTKTLGSNGEGGSDVIAGDVLKIGLRSFCERVVSCLSVRLWGVLFDSPPPYIFLNRQFLNPSSYFEGKRHAYVWVKTSHTSNENVSYIK